jgi:DNA-binding PadR family transcriptional regulator
MSSLGQFQQKVLWTLVRLGDRAYGMRIRQELQEVLGSFVSIGAVYTTLDRLEEKGLVFSSLGDSTPQRGGRAKRYFWITGAGALALQESAEAFDSVRGLIPRRAT